MIRLGTLAGFPFEGPRVLAGWTPPREPGVYVITYKPDPDRDQHAVIYVDHSDDLSAEKFPFRHPRSAAWIKRAGSKYGLYIAYYNPLGATTAHRDQIARELMAVYHPGCNDEQYDLAWKDDWMLQEWVDDPAHSAGAKIKPPAETKKPPA
ncbi:MAG: hypothetical protein J2P26_13675 [Nocardiopsaceae bacterium]|nr:hypothetical protein [Nocardiopsaceae bacterium]